MTAHSVLKNKHPAACCLQKVSQGYNDPCFYEVYVKNPKVALCFWNVYQGHNVHLMLGILRQPFLRGVCQNPNVAQHLAMEVYDRAIMTVNWLPWSQSFTEVTKYMSQPQDCMLFTKWTPKDHNVILYSGQYVVISQPTSSVPPHLWQWIYQSYFDMLLGQHILKPQCSMLFRQNILQYAILCVALDK